MVNLTRIYTRTGDGGETRLGDMSLTTKNDPRLLAYADVDEANAALGVALATGGLEDDVVEVLVHAQNDLFDVGADLCTPEEEEPKYPPLRIVQAQVDRLEAEIDAMNADLAPLTSFILPGGSPAAAHLHLARTVVRRAERLMTDLARHEPVTAAALKYVNRLSDHLFVLSRVVNRNGADDVLWVPGANR